MKISGEIIGRLPFHRVLVRKETDSTGEARPDDGKQRAIEELRRTDAEVRAHEGKHLAAAGGSAVSGPTYHYTIGPDGKAYAVGGEVTVSTGYSSDPEKTRRNAQNLLDSALAPGSPSPQDLSAAAAAREMISSIKSGRAPEKTAESTSPEPHSSGTLFSRTHNDLFHSPRPYRPGSIIDLWA